MARYAIGIILVVFAAGAAADKDRYATKDHEHDANVDVEQRQDMDQSQDQDQQQDQMQDQQQSQTQANDQNVNIEDRKQAPGIGLSTPYGSTGIGITTPAGGLMVNLPWSWGDRRVLPICDRLMESGELVQWAGCICMTSVMKKLHETPEACTASLGGGSGSAGK